MNAPTKRKERRELSPVMARLLAEQQDYLPAASFAIEQDDLIFVIFGYMDIPTLLRIQRICSHWKSMIGRRVIPGILGSKEFMRREELVEMVQKYSNHKLQFADGLARTYGWPIGKWNVSRITNFECVFDSLHYFNEDISEWDISNATNLSCMFYRASSFNQDLSKWNTSKVTCMCGMFLGAASFNGDISKWNTSNVANMSFMFSAATLFNGDISQWDTSNVTDVTSMFNRAKAFNQNISSWNVANAESEDNLFHGATSFHPKNAPRFIHFTVERRAD
mmetsp:Transcript_8480/g.13074  ORF Transcript_8480/g.13074 Transcript_8480/m.13074 type:complete len:278 (-) Transcript_8480:119-952(-)